jgi:hypothetical protein
MKRYISMQKIWFLVPEVFVRQTLVVMFIEKVQRERMAVKWEAAAAVIKL